MLVKTQATTIAPSWTGGTVEIGSFIGTPNPTEGLVNLPKSGKWSATNMLGDIVVEGNGQVVDLNSESSGVYFIQTESNTFKIVEK